MTMMMTMMNIVIDKDDGDAKRHWNTDNFQMMIWALSLITPPLGGHRVILFEMQYTYFLHPLLLYSVIHSDVIIYNGLLIRSIYSTAPWLLPSKQINLNEFNSLCAAHFFLLQFWKTFEGGIDGEGIKDLKIVPQFWLDRQLDQQVAARQ